MTPENTYASPTPVIEAGRVYVHFGTYGTAAVDTASGEVLWSRRDLNCDHEVGAGPASSPSLVGDLVVLHVDGRDVQYVVALDKTNGETVWKSMRSVHFFKVPVHERKAYCMPTRASPLLVGDLLFVVNRDGIVSSLEAKSGTVIWQERMKGSFSASPIYAKDRI